MNLSNKEILEMILSANEEFSKNAQRMEQLASQIEQSNQRYLNELKRTQIRVDSVIFPLLRTLKSRVFI